MSFEVTHVSRGDIHLKSNKKLVRVLGEALIASTPTDPSYVVYLNSFDNAGESPGTALTEMEKQDVINSITKYFRDRGSVVDFE